MAVIVNDDWISHLKSLEDQSLRLESKQIDYLPDNTKYSTRVIG